MYGSQAEPVNRTLTCSPIRGPPTLFSHCGLNNLAEFLVSEGLSLKPVG